MFSFLKKENHRAHVPPIVRTIKPNFGDKNDAANVSSSPEPTTTTKGSYVYADGLIDRSDQLSHVGLVFVECLNASLHLAAHLAMSVAVVRTSTTTKVAALLVSPSVTDDDLIEYEAILNKNGWWLPKEGPQVWRVVPSILMSITKGHLGAQHISAVQSIGSDAGKSALWRTFVDVAQWAYDNGANDIDFAVKTTAPMSQICFKIDGRYLSPERWRLPTTTMLQLLGIAWQRSDGGSDATFQARIVQQCGIEVDLAKDVRIRLRWSGMPVDVGPVITMRVQKLGSSAVVKTLEDAGYLPWHLEAFSRVVAARGGLTTLAGTVGSGKTLTLSILMGLLPDHIKKISMEDPVEIEMPNVYQMTIPRDLVKTGDGADAAFASATRALFRSAVDAFLMGEIRDPETARVARAVLESGHSIYTTTHAANVLGIFARYVSPQIGIPLDVLATPGNVRLNVYQALLPKNCPHCAKSPSDHIKENKMNGHALAVFQQYLQRFEQLYGFAAERLKFRDQRGCSVCRKADISELNGFAGRTVAAEMLEPDETMCSLLLSGDQVALRRYWRGLSDGRYDSPNFAGKTAMEVAVYKASLGQIDPREVELHFESFAAIEHQRMVRPFGAAHNPVRRTVELAV